MNSKQSTIILFSLSVIFVVINMMTLKDGHMLGGDFAQYVQHAVNIAEGKPYDHGLNLDAWVLCAPGLPLLLAPIIKFFGINLTVMKFLNVAFWLMFCLTLYRILRTKLDEDLAVSATAVMLLSHFFFIFKQNILTDMPFVFFVTAAIYLFEKYWRSEGKARGRALIWFIAVALVAFLFRYVGILLSVAAVLYAWLFKKDKRPILPIVVGMVAGLVIQFMIGASAGGHFSELPTRVSEWLTLSYLNISYVFFCFFYFYIPGRTLVELALQSAIVPVIDLFSLVIAAVLFWIFYRRCRNGKISFSEYFFFIYLAGLMFWPLVDGSRYLFPVVGLGWIVLYEGFAETAVFFKKRIPAASDVWKSILKSFAIVFLLINVTGIVADFRFDDDELNEPQLQQVFQWVRDNVADDEPVLFRYARELSLYTRKPSATLWYRGKDRNQFSERAEYFRARYVINDKVRDEFQLTDGLEGRTVLTWAWENDKYRIFEVKRGTGYFSP